MNTNTPETVNPAHAAYTRAEIRNAVAIFNAAQSEESTARKAALAVRKGEALAVRAALRSPLLRKADAVNRAAAAAVAAGYAGAGLLAASNALRDFLADKGNAAALPSLAAETLAAINAGPGSFAVPKGGKVLRGPVPSKAFRAAVRALVRAETEAIAARAKHVNIAAAASEIAARAAAAAPKKDKPATRAELAAELAAVRAELAALRKAK